MIPMYLNFNKKEMYVAKNQTEFRLTGAAGKYRINCRQHLFSAQNISMFKQESRSGAV